MQTVWSRVAQARTICNCPSCVSTTNAIARRATTATARRTVRVGDVYTVSLSSLAAGLAFADSRKKDDRRKQWDKVIGEARATVEATEIQQQSRLAALSDNARVESPDNARAAPRDVTAERAYEEVEAWDVPENEDRDRRVPTLGNGNDTWIDVFDWAREQHRIREASGFQDWKGPPLSLLQSLSKAQLNELLSDESLLRRFYGGPDCDNLVDAPADMPLSTKKIRTLEWSVAKMVLKLLMYCSKDSVQPTKDYNCPTNSLLRQLLKEEAFQSKLDYKRECLRTLHSECRSWSYYEDFERPQVPNYDDTAVEDCAQTTHMNLSLQELLGLMKQGSNLSDLMSKICYNLLTARTPPNIHTYNMLLVRFSVLDKSDLVRSVLTSMRESHIRPNEITHAALLRHFTATGNRSGFRQYWRRMEGHNGGLALANPKQSIHPVVEDRYLVFGRNSHKATERARMNGQVYESLIIGAIQFLSGQTAMHYYRKMISEGWSPSLGIALAILQDCCHRLDWTVGTAVLEQLEKTAESMNTLTYEWMLRLCQCCAQHEFFDQIMLNGVLCGALPASMLDLPDHAKAEDVAFLIECAKDLQPRKATGKLKTPAVKISRRLGDKSPFLLENIFHDCQDDHTLCQTINRTNSRYKTRRALQNRLDAISIDIEHTVLEANKVLASESLSSVKFWLSKRVKHLEQELEQKANNVAYALSSDVGKHKQVQKPQPGKAENGKGESGKSVEMPIISGPFGTKYGFGIDPAPRDVDNTNWSNRIRRVVTEDPMATPVYHIAPPSLIPKSPTTDSTLDTR